MLGMFSLINLNPKPRTELMLATLPWLKSISWDVVVVVVKLAQELVLPATWKTGNSEETGK